ncbi:MAG TPA: hypothetical protein VG675_12940 [Bryobacteraceae bacterium]|nr:hypothetical protein [Bryobacteraceae bacterium]
MRHTVKTIASLLRSMLLLISVFVSVQAAFAQRNPGDLTIDPNSFECFPYGTCIEFTDGTGFYAAIQAQADCLDDLGDYYSTVSASDSIDVDPLCDNVDATLGGEYGDPYVHAWVASVDTTTYLEGDGDTYDDCVFGSFSSGGGNFECSSTFWDWVVSLF